MAFWVAMAVLTAAVTVALLVPLFRKRAAADDAGPQSAIYRDQLAEIARDVARGVLPEDEAAAARAEIGRRLLHVEPATRVPGPSSSRQRLAMAAAMVVVPAVAVGGYLLLGSPDRPDMPQAARLAAPNADDIPALVAMLEGVLAGRPDDPQGWSYIIPLYMRAGEFDKAVGAYAQLIRLKGAEADPRGELGSAIGQAIIDAAGGITDSALRVFMLAKDLNPEAILPRFYVAVSLSDTGRREEAAAAWRDLIADAPEAGAPWVDFAKAELAKLEPAEPPAAAGPTPADIAAARDLPPDERNAMIASMVDRLAQRLADDPNDADGWAQLLRSYMVLGRPDDARAALANARTALAGSPETLAAVEAAAKTLELQ